MLTAKLIHEASEEAYCLASEKVGIPPDNLFGFSACNIFTHTLANRLASRGLDPDEMSIISISGPTTPWHVLMRLESDHGPIVVDGTWQQFLPTREKSATERPKVLVGTCEVALGILANTPIQDNLIERVWGRVFKIPPEPVDYSGTEFTPAKLSAGITYHEVYSY